MRLDLGEKRSLEKHMSARSGVPVLEISSGLLWF